MAYELDFDEDCSTIWYHMFSMTVSIFPLAGAVITDKWLGKYEFILYSSLVYAVGGAILVAGTIKEYELPMETTSFFGLLLIAIAAGGIKPCVSTFGSDQFKLPAQADKLATFFTVFHICVSVASILGAAITPILREDYSCFNDRYCFPMAFAPPAVFLIAVLVILAAANKLFVIKPPSDSMMFGVTNCIISAFRGWANEHKTQPRKHLLDYAEHKLGQKVVYDSKVMINILILYIPLSFFWALFNQQGSRWTLQAARMDGWALGYEIKPDQMQITNLILLVILKPVLSYIINPFLSLVHIRRPLQRVVFASLLAAGAFVFASYVEKKLDACIVRTMPDFACHLKIFNGSPKTYLFQLRTYDEDIEFDLKNMEVFDHVFLGDNSSLEETMHLSGKISSEYNKCHYYVPFILKLELDKKFTYYLTDDTLEQFNPRLDNPKLRYPRITTLIGTDKLTRHTLFMRDSKNINFDVKSKKPKSTSVNGGNVSFYLGDELQNTFTVQKGGAYIVLGFGNDKGYKFRIFSAHNPCDVHMFWQLPQYILITIAEVMFSVSILEFTFEEATKTIKSTLQVYWMLIMALGDIIVIIIVDNKYVEKQSEEYILFAEIMIVAMIIFMLLAILYKSVDENSGTVTQPSKSAFRPNDRGRRSRSAPPDARRGPNAPQRPSARPRPSGRPGPGGGPRPSGRPGPGVGPRPSGRPGPGGGPRPSGRPGPGGGPRPSGRPGPGGRPGPSGQPRPSGRPRPNPANAPPRPRSSNR